MALCGWAPKGGYFAPLSGEPAGEVRPRAPSSKPVARNSPLSPTEHSASRTGRFLCEAVRFPKPSTALLYRGGSADEVQPGGTSLLPWSFRVFLDHLAGNRPRRRARSSKPEKFPHGILHGAQRDPRREKRVVSVWIPCRHFLKIPDFRCCPC